MNSKKGTVRALIIVSVALALCLAMLVGSTLAWFNDSVTSAVNVIEAGNLDVVLNYYDTDAGKWTELGTEKKLFTETNWAPGRTEVVYFEIENNGSLPLKYNFGINLLSEKPGENQKGEEFKLSKFLNYGIVENVDPETSNLGDAAYNSVKNAYSFQDSLSSLNSARGQLASDEIKKVALVVWMPASLGNEVNHNGENVPSIEFGVSVYAAQLEADGGELNPGNVPTATVTTYTKAELEALNKDIADGNEDITFIFNYNPGNNFVFKSAYEFKSNHNYDDQVSDDDVDPNSNDVRNSYYKDWNADYYVKVDRNIDADTIVLAGKYDKFADMWVAFANPDAVTAETWIPLLGSVTQNPWTYEDVVKEVGTFLCGVGEVPGKITEPLNFTVELRLTNPDDETDYFVVNSTTYTFTGRTIPSDMPVAKVTDDNEHENTFIDWDDSTNYKPSYLNQQLEAAYVFEAPHAASDMSECPYADWYTDYVVSIDRDITAGQIFLGGYYESFNAWVGFENPNPVTANEEIELLGSVTQNPWTYAMIVNNVGTFTCGVARTQYEDVAKTLENKEALKGATFTVKLRLTNPENEAEFYDVNTVSYTFQ